MHSCSRVRTYGKTHASQEIAKARVAAERIPRRQNLQQYRFAHGDSGGQRLTLGPGTFGLAIPRRFWPGCGALFGNISYHLETC